MADLERIAAKALLKSDPVFKALVGDDSELIKELVGPVKKAGAVFRSIPKTETAMSIHLRLSHGISKHISTELGPPEAAFNGTKVPRNKYSMEEMHKLHHEHHNKFPDIKHHHDEVTKSEVTKSNPAPSDVHVNKPLKVKGKTMVIRPQDEEKIKKLYSEYRDATPGELTNQRRVDIKRHPIASRVPKVKNRFAPEKYKSGITMVTDESGPFTTNSTRTTKTPYGHEDTPFGPSKKVKQFSPDSLNAEIKPGVPKKHYLPVEKSREDFVELMKAAVDAG
jgi:hypothetical protein